MVAGRCQACGMAVGLLADVRPHLVIKSRDFHLGTTADHVQVDLASPR